MTWCRIARDDGPAYAFVDGDVVELIEGTPWGAAKRTGTRLDLAAVALLPPVDPPNFYAAGINFVSHIEWANRHHGMALKVPQQADIGSRSASALIGSGADIIVPEDSQGPLEYEGELVAVVGRRARHLDERGALDCIAGYTLGNDLSERSWQRSDRTLWRAKNADTFKPMGPVVVPGLDPAAQTIAVRINGQQVSEYNTRDAIFSLRDFLVRMSRYVTLHPGDVIWLGCDGATLPPLVPGDTVEVVNEAIGVLRNRVVRAR